MQTQIKVRGFHLDVYQHVNNARYLEFLEEARWTLLENQGSLAFFENSHYTLAVVNINIDYRRAAYMGEVLRITTTMKTIGNRSCVMRQLITLKGTDTVVADASVAFVVVDTRTEKAAALEGELRTVIERLAEPS